MEIHDKLFNALPCVRYVAVASVDNLAMHERPGIVNSSDSESDKYEELLVNPALILLAKRRGEIDCGGLDYLVVRYGSFYQFILPTDDGHVSVAIDLNANLEQSIDEIHSILKATL